MSKKPLSPNEIRKQLDRISADIEKATEKGLRSAAVDLKSLETALDDDASDEAPLFTLIASARTELSLGKIEAAQDLILKARFLTEPDARL